MVQVYAFALSPSNIACVLETGLALVQTGRLQVTAAHQGACQGWRTTGCTNQVATEFSWFRDRDRGHRRYELPVQSGL